MKPTEEELKENVEEQHHVLQQVLSSLHEQSDQLAQINHRLDSMQDHNSVVVDWVNRKLSKKAKKKQKKKGKAAKGKSQ